MKKRDRNLAVGALVAAGVGYVAGILTAPKKGSETRKDIIDTAVKTKIQAEKTFKKLNTEFSELIKKGESAFNKAKSSSKDELGERLKQAKKAHEQVREILSAIHEGDAEDKDLKKALDESNKALDHLKKYLSRDGSSS